MREGRRRRWRRRAQNARHKAPTCATASGTSSAACRTSRRRPSFTPPVAHRSGTLIPPAHARVCGNGATVCAGTGRPCGGVQEAAGNRRRLALAVETRLEIEQLFPDEAAEPPESTHTLTGN